MPKKMQLDLRYQTSLILLLTPHPHILSIQLMGQRLLGEKNPFSQVHEVVLAHNHHLRKASERKDGVKPCLTSSPTWGHVKIPDMSHPASRTGSAER